MKRFVFSLLFLLFSFSVFAAPTINVIPNKATYQVGDPVSLAITLSGSPQIHGGGLNVRYNPNVLKAQSVVVDKVWSFANRPGVINNVAGSISDILFSSFNPIEGNQGVAVIQLAVVGNGDSGFYVTASEKNPFVDTNSQVVSFSINNLFALNTEVAETTEEATEEATEAETSTQSTSEATIEAALQPAEQNTEQTAVPSSNVNESTPVRSNNATLVRGPNNAIDDEVAVVSQNDRQFFLPSGTAAIPIDVTEDDNVAGQSGNATRSDNVEVAKNVDTFLSTPEIAAADEQGAQSISEISPLDDADVMAPESSIDYLNIVFILGVVFILIVIFKLFF